MRSPAEGPLEEDPPLRIKLRLITASEKASIGKNDLHTDMMKAPIRPLVQQEVMAVAGMIKGDVHIDLSKVVNILAGRLVEIDALREAVEETIHLGDFDGDLTKEDWFVLLARWVIETQLAAGLEWSPERSLSPVQDTRNPPPPDSA